MSQSGHVLRMQAQNVSNVTLPPVRNAQTLVVEGRGLHSGKLFRLFISPGVNDEHGIVFHYNRDGVEFTAPAYWLRVSGTSRATALILRGESRRRFEISTVEHFLAAAHVSGRHKLDVEIETPEGPLDALEMPALDGSALDWYRALERLPESRPGKRLASNEWECWKIIRSLEVADGRKKVVFSPLADEQDHFTRYHCNVDFGGIWKQSAFFEMNWRDPKSARSEFLERIAPARTFGFQHELEALRKRGLAKGGNLDNALLLDGDKVVNQEGLKLANELAAHKLMDAVGDLFLLGAPLLGRVDITEAGHSMHVRAIEEAFRTGALVKGRLPIAGSFIRD